MICKSNHHPGSIHHHMNNGRSGGDSSRSRYLGEQGTLTGTLKQDPRVYCNQDGSRTYMFQLNVESRTGNPNNDQLNHAAALVAYVPVGNTDYCAALRQGDCVNVRYVVQTDYYRNREGRPTKKTFLSAKGVYPSRQGKRPLPERCRSQPPRTSRRGGLPAAPRPFYPSENRQDSGMEEGRD